MISYIEQQDRKIFFETQIENFSEAQREDFEAFQRGIMTPYYISERDGLVEELSDDRADFRESRLDLLADLQEEDQQRAFMDRLSPAKLARIAQDHEIERAELLEALEAQDYDLRHEFEYRCEKEDEYLAQLVEDDRQMRREDLEYEFRVRIKELRDQGLKPKARRELEKALEEELELNLAAV